MMLLCVRTKRPTDAKLLATLEGIGMHLDAGGVWDQPFCVSLILPGTIGLWIDGPGRVPMFDDVDGSFNPEGPIGVHHRLGI